MDRRADIIAAGVAGVVGLIAIIGSTFIPTSSLDDIVGAKFFPTAAGVIMCAGAIVLTVRQLLLIRRGAGIVGDADGAVDDPAYPSAPWRPLAIATGGILYVGLMQLITYIPATVIGIAAAMIAMGIRRPIFIAAFSVGLAVAVWLGFGLALRIPLP